MDMIIFKRVIWIWGECRWLMIRAIHKLTGKYLIDRRAYGNHMFHSAQQGNDRIYELLQNGRPFSLCRFSFVEMDLMVRCKTEDYFGIKSYMFKRDIMQMYKVSNQNRNYGIRKFYHLMMDALEQADILGIWSNLPMGDVLINAMPGMEDKFMTDAICVEPYIFSKPWTKALEGKRVLVVSPFSELVKEQYNNRLFLWDNSDMLPKFDLETVDSVWYFFGCRDLRFGDWFEACDYLYREIMKHDFDVALLGCGPFGVPIAGRIKKEGKQAIHMGGAVQLLFGIKGKRWDETAIREYYNDYWVRPGDETKPIESDKLDNNCYW